MQPLDCLVSSCLLLLHELKLQLHAIMTDDDDDRVMSCDFCGGGYVGCPKVSSLLTMESFFSNCSFNLLVGCLP